MLPKIYRLRLKKDFDGIFRRGRFVSQKFFTLGFAKNDLVFSRFAVVVSKKVDKSAVVRNSTRRKASEIIRLNLGKIKLGFDLVFLAKAGAKGKGYKELEEDVHELIKKAKLDL